MIFRQIVFYALFVGVLSGTLLTAVQTWQVVPIIKGAEAYESASADVQTDGHTHSHASEDEEWAPEEGAERVVFTFLSNTLTAIGFSLLMIGAIAAASKYKDGNKEKYNWKHGLLWGASGYLVFWLIPALGLPPEIPLAEAAPLQERQLWWLLAVVCAAFAFLGLAFGKSPWRWIAPLVIFLPYLVGAPHPDSAMFAGQTAEAASALEILAKQFIGATAVANAIFWIALGSLSVWAMQRISFAKER